MTTAIRIIAALVASVSLAVSADPPPQTVTILPSSTDPATIEAPPCKAGTYLDFQAQTGVVTHAAAGALVVVLGTTRGMFDGLYRVTEYSFKRDADRAVIETKFKAVCYRDGK